MRDLTYPSVVLACKTGFRLLGQRFDIVGAEHVPRHGPALLASNHISSVDFVYGGLAAQPSKRVVRFMAKREMFENPAAGAFLRSMHHIEVDRTGGGASSYRQAVSYLRSGEIVGIFPEATISRAFVIKDLKSGAVRIAAEAGVPLLPMIVWGTQRILTKDHPRDLGRGKTIAIRVGEPMFPTAEDPTAETAELKDRLSELLDDAITAYPSQEQPPGSWWLPASYGGSAPTLQEAVVLDAQERRDRAARRAAREAKARKRS